MKGISYVKHVPTFLKEFEAKNHVIMHDYLQDKFTYEDDDPSTTSTRPPHAKRRRVSEADEGEVQIKAAHGADEHFSSTTTKEETTSTVQSKVDKNKKPEVKEPRDKDDGGTQLKFKKPATGTLSNAKRLEMKRKKADTKKLSFSVDDDE